MLTCHESIQAATSRILPRPLLILASCLLLMGCAQQEDAVSEAPAEADTYFPIKVGGHTLHLQLALTAAEHQKGLMFRDVLPKDHGMLFIFQRPKQQGFWMKNTSLPLDIAYVAADGELLEIRKLFPYDETPVVSSSRNILIAIETNRGWFARNGVKPGARLDMEALKDAIARRGLSPAQYAIED